MKLDAIHLRSKIELSSLRGYGIGTWAVLIVLSLLLVAAGVLGYLGWTSSDNSVPESAMSPWRLVFFSRSPSASD